jgi:hypothetical protein
MSERNVNFPVRSDHRLAPLRSGVALVRPGLFSPVIPAVGLAVSFPQNSPRISSMGGHVWALPDLFDGIDLSASAIFIHDLTYCLSASYKHIVALDLRKCETPLRRCKTDQGGLSLASYTRLFINNLRGLCQLASCAFCCFPQFFPKTPKQKYSQGGSHA